MDHQLKQLQDWISESRHIVFFGGAGVSTESGIPDFRSVDGLYHQQYAFPPETILSHSFFERNVALQTSCEKFSYNLQKRNGA